MGTSGENGSKLLRGTRPTVAATRGQVPTIFLLALSSGLFASALALGVPPWWLCAVSLVLGAVIPSALQLGVFAEAATFFAVLVYLFVARVILVGSSVQHASLKALQAVLIVLVVAALRARVTRTLDSSRLSSHIPE